MGFDFIWIDMEHTPTDHQVLMNHLIAAKAGGTDSIVRIPWNDPIMVKRVLDMGPNGILFPTINTVEELDLAMRSTLYPPEGNRGFGPIRAVNYALMDQEYYINHVLILGYVPWKSRIRPSVLSENAVVLVTDDDAVESRLENCRLAVKSVRYGIVVVIVLDVVIVRDAGDNLVITR